MTSDHTRDHEHGHGARPHHRHEAGRPARFGALGTAPWRRAPLLLLRQPMVFLAIVGASGILATAAASGPLFLSTIGTASFAAQAAQTCPENGQPTVEATTSSRTSVDTLRARGLDAMRANAIADPYTSTSGYATVSASLVHLFARDGALDHVTTLTPNTGQPGAWVPNVFAAKIHARPGDTIRTADGSPIRVAGIYRDLAPNPFALSHLAPYWCLYTNQIVSTVASDGAIAATPPLFRQGPWLIADPGTVVSGSSSAIRLLWSATVPPSSNSLSRFATAIGQARSAATAIGGGAHPLPGLAQLVDAAHTARAGISGSIVPIEVAGVVVAALLVGGAGLFWAAARQREVRLLVARGVGPFALAGKAILETLTPAVIGAAAGYVATSHLVRAVGPARTLESNAPVVALRLVAATLAAGLVLIGVIGALAGRERRIGRRTAWWRMVPWELGLLAAAIGLAVTHDQASAVSVDHTIVTISPIVVLYPLLGATAALLLVGRLAGFLLHGARRSFPNAGTARYLALRRMSRSRAIAVALVIGTALPCALLMYGSTVTDTVSTEVQRKYETNLGAPHVFQIYGVHGALFATHGHGTHVVIYEQDIYFDPDHETDVIGIDPATFARFAFTDSAQRAAVGELHDVARGAPIPAIIVNGAGVPSDTSVDIGQTKLALQPVAHLAVFPGLRNSAYPLVVVDQRTLRNIDPNVERLNQLWTDDAQYAPARRLVGRLGYSILFQITSDFVIGTTGLLPITWLFGYLRALAVLIGVVAVAGLVFGLASRTRRRKVSYVLSRRMGMTRTAHLNSLFIELFTVVGLGWVAGSGFGIGAFRAVFHGFDVYPQLKPPAAFVVPQTPIVVSAAIAAGVVVLAAVGTQLLAERTRPAEILRIE